jgi:hypothetical protein
MEPDIQLLELADGIRLALVNSGFLTIKSILRSTASDISHKVGVDLYIAQIIFQEAKRVATVMTEASTMPDTSPAASAGSPTAVAIDKEELNIV